MSDNYDLLEQRFAAWAAGEPALHALLVVGSRARLPLPDVNSDLDLIALTIESTRHTAYRDSLHEIGELWCDAMSTGARAR